MDKTADKNPVPSEMPSPELPQQEPQKKKISKLLLIVFIVVILSVLSLLALALVRGTKETPPVANKDKSSKAELLFTTPIPFQFISVDTSTWQALADDTLGVKVKFPKDWHEASQENTSPGHMILTNYSYKEVWEFTNNKTDKEQNRLDINLRSINNTQSIDQWFEKFFKDDPLPDISEKKLVLIKNNQVVNVTNKRTWTDSYNKTHEEVLDRYFVPHKNRVIEVSFSNTNPQDVQIYENILANLETYNPPIIAGTYKTSTENIFQQPLRETQIFEDQLRYQHNYVFAPRDNVESGELIFYSDDGEVYLLSKALEEKLNRVTGIIKNPKDKDVVFVSSIDEASLTASDGCVNTYYTLNLKTGELVQFYKESPPETNNRQCSKEIAGIQGSKLILHADAIDNSPGPCTNRWFHYKDNFYYFELSDLKSNFKQFTIPSYRLQQAQQEITKCQNDMSPQE